MILTDIGTVEYNGFRFDGASSVTISGEPVYDDAGRTVVYHRYRIRVQSTVADGEATDNQMIDVRSRLTKAGEALRVTGKGFGTLEVNSGNNCNDVAFGPKPRVIDWQPIGSLRACEVVWECETCIAYCYTPVQAEGIIAFNYRVDYTLDYRGVTTRTISGYLEIAMSRQGAQIPDTADQYRALIAPVIPDRFQRTNQTFNLSLDKRRLDYSITDTEVYSWQALPPGVVRASGRHSVNWSRRGGGACRLRNRLTLEVELSPTYNIVQAVAVFLAIAKARIQIAQARSNYGCMIEDLTIEEDLFGHSASFGVTFITYSPLREILLDSGIWTPVGTDWNLWRASVASLYGTYGYAGLMQFAANDAIVDICNGAEPNWGATQYTQPANTTTPMVGLRNYTPQPQYSWQDYECHIAIFRGHTTVRQAVLQSPDPDEQDANPQDTEITFPAQGGIDDLFQQSGRTRYTARIWGHARRAGFPVPRPHLTKVGTADVKQQGRDEFRSRCVGNWLGVPVYEAHWSIDYALNKSPLAPKTPANLAEGVDGDGQAAVPIIPIGLP
jgi:hypothetical protein